MSSTHRTPDIEPNPEEFFATPDWAVRALLPLIREHDPKLIIDPGCGIGNIMLVLRDAWPNATVIGVESNRHRAACCLDLNRGCVVITGDYLDPDVANVLRASGRADLIVGNPPFSKLRQFIEQSLEVSPHATICMLSRLNWLAGAREKDPARKVLLRRHMPFVGVLERRPPFGKNKAGRIGTDSTEYAWLCFGGPRGGYEILDCERPVRAKRAVVTPIPPTTGLENLTQ